MSYILEVQEDENGDQYIVLPDEIIEDLGWQRRRYFKLGCAQAMELFFSKVHDPIGYEVFED
jgi:hypothetical protein